MTRNEVINAMIDDIMRQCVELGVSGLISINGINRLILNTEDTHLIEQYKTLVKKITSDDYEKEFRRNFFDLIIKLISSFNNEEDYFFTNFKLSINSLNHVSKIHRVKLDDFWYHIVFTIIPDDINPVSIDYYQLSIYEAKDEEDPLASIPMMTIKIYDRSEFVTKRFRMEINNCQIWTTSDHKIEFSRLNEYMPLPGGDSYDYYDDILPILNYITDGDKIPTPAEMADYKITSKFQIKKNEEIDL